MKQTTRVILFGLSCAGVGAGITGMYMEVKRAEDQLELISVMYEGFIDMYKIMYEGCIDMYKKLLETSSRPKVTYARNSHDWEPYSRHTEEEKKDETMA